MASTHQTVKLDFTKREGTGKGTCRKLRSKDQLPVVLYGPEYKNGLAGVISARAVAPVANSAHRETTLIELDFADGGSATALIRDVQRHPLTRRVIHIDFYQVLKGHMIKVEVPIRVINEELCKGIKDDGGVLVYGERAILVEVQPSDIPEEIVFDAQALEVGSEVFVKDLALPEGVTAVTDADLLVLHVEQPKEEAEAAPAETEENTEVEVVAKGKAAKEE